MLAALMILSLAACAGNVTEKPEEDTQEPVSYENNESGEEETRMYSDTIIAGKYSFTKITDYLFETTMDDYEQNYGAACDFFTRYNPKLGGCSSVQNGKIRGRNYDWTFDEEPEFVIHVPANDKGRHASMGVAATTEITAADVETGKVFDIYDIIPYFTLDGINDAGLTININVVGYEEMGEYMLKSQDPADWVCPLAVPRILLDNAGSIDEALALMEKMDIFSLGTAEEAHFMISGPQSADDDTFNTVVVELIPDENKHYQLSVIDYNKGDFVEDKPIMTNFHVTGYDGTLESATKHPMGYERYQILRENFDQGSDVSGMIDLMKKVYYTRDYDLYNENYWYSEATGGDLTMDDVGEPNLMGDLSRAGKFADVLREGVENYKSMKRNGTVWHTVHTSVYDIDNMTLYILPQEAGFSYEIKF